MDKIRGPMITGIKDIFRLRLAIKNLKNWLENQTVMSGIFSRTGIREEEF